MDNWSVRFNNIGLKRGSRVVLNGVDIQLSNAELVLMTGQNGSGKSTLLKILAGLLKPEQAYISLSPHNGQQLEHNWSRMRRVLRQRVCYLHQQPYLFHGSVFDNVAYGLKRKGLSGEQIKQQVSRMLEEFSLQDLINRDCRELSGGEKQRVAIVRSWITQPDIILLDEPFSNMDKESRRKCYTLINHLCRDNIALVLTSHDPLSGELDFTQHIHLYQGKITHKTPNIKSK